MVWLSLLTTYSFGYGKLRLEFNWDVFDNLMLAGNVNGQKYFGKTKWDLMSFLPYDSVWTSEGTLYTLPFTIKDTAYIDNLYASVHFKSLDVTIGRQPISIGTGYAWNPLDVFNKKDLMDPTYEQPGINAIRTEIPLTDRFSLDCIIAESDSIKTGIKMLQLKTGVGSFDLTFNVTQRHRLIPYWRFADLSSTHKTSKFIGGSFVGQVGEIGLWGEILGSTNIIWGDIESVFGMDHTTDGGLYIMTEYFHNSLGAKNDELSFYHYVYAFEGESKSLMQDYLFIMAMRSLNDFMTGSIIAFGNLNDRSFTLLPQIEWNVFENVNLSLMMSKSFGNEDTEFGIQDQTFRLRLRAYF